MTILNQLMSFFGCLWNVVVDLDFLMFACMNLKGKSEGGREGGESGRGREREGKSNERGDSTTLLPKEKAPNGLKL